MTPDDFAKTLYRQPFEPFRIHLSDDTNYEVKHPEMVLLGHRSAQIGLDERRNGSGPVYRRIETFSLLHVVRLEPLMVPSSPE
jgi:hypothetical protein